MMRRWQLYLAIADIDEATGLVCTDGATAPR